MDIKPFVEEIERKKLNCEGVIVMQHGVKIAEHRWIPEVPRNQYSIAKSFTSIAIGMAIDRGKLWLGSRVVDSLPEKNRMALMQRKPVKDIRGGPAMSLMVYKPGKILSLTLEHLLTMTRGHKFFSRPLTVAEAISQPLAYHPGARFIYDNGSTFLASAIFTHAVGMTVRDFLLDALFRPLGIPDPEWPTSADGHTVGASGLFLTTSDLARFGQFLLQRGRWEGKQLVPQNWIENASRPQINTRLRQPDNDLGYGWGFWPCRHGAFRADGKLGQYVMVLPRHDAVIAINADEPEPATILYTVWDKILPLL